MTLGPASITIRCDLPLDRVDSDLYQLERVAGTQRPTLSVELRGSGPSEVNVDPASGNVELCAVAADLEAEDLSFLAYLVLESRLHLHGIVTLHGAAIERAGQAVLLLGHPGAGKTTTALRLCREHGYSLLGNDLVVAGGPGAPLVHAGSRTITLRQASVAAVMPELLGHFATRSEDPRRSKIALRPADLGILPGRPQSEVAQVIFVHSDLAYPSAIDLPGDSLPHRLNLHENSLRYIRAGSTPWLIGERRQFGPYVPSLDSPAAHNARVCTLGRLLGRSRYVAGPPGAVADLIAGAVWSPETRVLGGSR